jgi:hypothetical protein
VGGAAVVTGFVDAIEEMAVGEGAFELWRASLQPVRQEASATVKRTMLGIPDRLRLRLARFTL